MLGRGQWQTVVVTGIVEASVTLSTFMWALGHRDLAAARDLTFSVIVVAELLRAFAARSDTRLFLEVGPFTNRRLLAVIGVSLLLQWALHYVPAMQRLFELQPVAGADAIRVLLLGAIPVTFLEVRKLLRRRRRAAA
jgi:Ca2+-transporting ATPase